MLAVSESATNVISASQTKLTDTKRALLEAAAIEFAEHGYDGVRMEHVAKRAGYNKSLVYRYFSDKRGLFTAMLRTVFEKRVTLLNSLPDSLDDLLVYWTRAQRSDPHFLRLIVREALQDDGKAPVEAETRRAYYQQQIEILDDLQAKEEVDPDFDPQMLFLALLAISVVPTILPQITRLVTGLDSTSQKFTKDWEAFQRLLAHRLAPS